MDQARCTKHCWFMNEWSKLTNKRKRKNRFNKTRIKHAHKSTVNIKTPKLMIKVHAWLALTCCLKVSLSILVPRYLYWCTASTGSRQERQQDDSSWNPQPSPLSWTQRRWSPYLDTKEMVSILGHKCAHVWRLTPVYSQIPWRHDQGFPHSIISNEILTYINCRYSLHHFQP